MKKQTNPTIKAHLIRGAFYLILLVAVCAIPFALAARNTAAGKTSRTAFNPNSAHRPTLAPASAFRVQAPNAKAIAKHSLIRSLLGNIPLFTYVIDDGTAEDSVGLTSGGTFVACNEFTVSGGNNVITSISIAFGTPLFPDPTLNGLPFTAALWSDPNGDGSPTDAVVLAMANGVISGAGTDTFVTVPIPPTMVTTANFFVGFLITHTAGQFPAGFDESNPIPNRSWVALTSSINDLSGAQTIESAGLLGNWMIRADGNTGGGGSPTPTPTGSPSCTPGYTTATSTGTITPGGTDTGNHCDDCNTDIVLPFPVNIYGAPVSVATVGSDGDIQLTASPGQKLFFALDQCVPVNPDPASHDPFLNTLFPYYADLVTDESVGPCTDCGIFTQTLGTAPNRQFVIRWKANYFNTPPGPAQAEFEVLLTEGSDTLSVIYGVTGDMGLTATTSGIQQDLNVFTPFSCNEATLIPGLRVDYIAASCGSPTPTPTATATATATATSSPSATATPTATAAPRSTPTPRPRPTPAPRP